ncbi:AAA family ATPase [Planctellipticum variicoloris]|uniref:AAA family ATPase n=1 Tax=Planctellipticum variicoloris TaxID=3064265 RepID=UPI003013FBD9|nr:ATP-binding protein [Planctomycetaceae bacterium SH412]
MLLRDLTIENFRSFDKYQLNGLARVNLLVGDNNCGKTSVLEAACLLLAEGRPLAVARLLHERGESRAVRRELSPTDSSDDRELNGSAYVEHLAVPMKSLFGAHNLARPGQVRLSAGIDRDITLSLGTVESLSSAGVFPHQNLLVDEGREAYVAESRPDGEVHQSISMLQAGGWLVSSNWLDAANRTTLLNRSDELPVGFLSARGMRPIAMRRGWNLLVERNRERFVEQTLQIILPELSRVFFLTEEGTQSNSRLGVLLEVDGIRTPLGWYGEGVGRLLGFGIAIGSTAGGFLAIDEIDTGLHYSKLGEMWRMVIKAAQELDVQVFATTHSLDCLNGLQDAIAADPDLAEHVAVHRIERAIKKAVSLSGEEFARAMLRESEIR